MSRDGITKEEALQKIRSQMPQSEKRKYAHHVIDTSGSRENSKSQVEELFKKL
jgi:dephospho-CoA kinase